MSASHQGRHNTEAILSARSQDTIIVHSSNVQQQSTDTHYGPAVIVSLSVHSYKQAWFALS